MNASLAESWVVRRAELPAGVDKGNQLMCQKIKSPYKTSFYKIGWLFINQKELKKP
ncbi:hypothetical protein [Pseudomonas sp. NFACC02]|uniref:hypothetical protein n=1 Tax=Pseudomonas sp. NFACC02 TaxID=1566250 RepID=UPI001587BC10|nr:hypothetical protein [Pseudomonas sp. NFACC02]